MHKKLKSILIIIGLMLVLAGCSNGQEQASLTTGLMKGQLAPDFTLKDINGKQFSLSSYKNKNTVCLVFWATWCPYCLKEIPKIKNIHSKFSSNGVKVISVDIATNDPIGRVKAFQKQLEIPYPILYDADNTVSRLYGISGVPASFIIDRQGIIRYRGYQLPEDIDGLFEQLL